METDKLVAEGRRILSDTKTIGDNGGRLLQIVAALSAFDETEDRGRDLMLRALEHRRRLEKYDSVIDSMLRQLRLMPYVSQPKALTSRELVAFEAHRPASMGDVVFHGPQAEIYFSLLEGQNVILSAPTSFGKSILVDALVASGKYRQVAIIVPTIALIDEYRERLARWRAGFRLITHPGQTYGASNNLIIVTQERAVELRNLPELDLLVVDEFYKLRLEEDPIRAALLNEAFYTYRKRAKQFFLLGPNVASVAPELLAIPNTRLFDRAFTTVATDVTRVDTKEGKEAALLNVCGTEEGQILVFTKSPDQATEIGLKLARAHVSRSGEQISDTLAFIDAEYSPDWSIREALASGVGIHHGNTPRWLQQKMVRDFNDEAIKILVCTSTLIEGVNTRAKAVMIFDNKVSNKLFDYFTFMNIKGRSGRMKQHFVGRVYLFHDPPKKELPFVDVPALSQTEDVPLSLLLQLDSADLSPQASSRLAELRTQSLLPIELLKENKGIDPLQQLSVARWLAQNGRSRANDLIWTGLPGWDQLKLLCELIWEHFVKHGKGQSRSVVSGAQLAYFANTLMHAKSHKNAVSQFVARQNGVVDDGISAMLSFVKQWSTFALPKFVMCIDRIQRHVLGSLLGKSGDYSVFAVHAANAFLKPPLYSLEEYGIPVPTIERLAPRLELATTLDELLSILRSLRLQDFPLSKFESETVDFVRRRY